MSAVFIVRFHGHPVRFRFAAGKSIYEVTTRELATPFISEADAWHAASHHGLSAEFLAIDNLSAAPAAKPEGALL